MPNVCTERERERERKKKRERGRGVEMEGEGGPQVGQLHQISTTKGARQETAGVGGLGTGDKATSKWTRQHKRGRGQEHAGQQEPTPWQSHNGSTRAAPPNRTRKQPIPGQKVQLGPIFERGNTWRLPHGKRQRVPIFRSDASNRSRI